jgi:SAM-dependent methyltransferase
MGTEQDQAKEQHYLDQNRALWDAWTDLHEQSEFYDVEGFLAGKSRLKPIELAEMPAVKNKSLLHLQCHFGLDTLSWARAGAQVTGVDFSDKSIRLARSLAERARLDARFVQSNIYDLPSALDDQFDIVFTSYGVLAWLPDLSRWARIIDRYLKPGGTFYLVELHPFGLMFESEGDIRDWKVVEPYFHAREPVRYVSEGSYAAPSADVHMPEYEWMHPISDVLNALLQVGLQIEFVHEFPYVTYRQFPFLERHGEWEWRPPKGMGQPPLLFSIRALKG